MSNYEAMSFLFYNFFSNITAKNLDTANTTSYNVLELTISLSKNTNIYGNCT